MTRRVVFISLLLALLTAFPAATLALDASPAAGSASEPLPTPEVPTLPTPSESEDPVAEFAPPPKQASHPLPRRHVPGPGSDAIPGDCPTLEGPGILVPGTTLSGVSTSNFDFCYYQYTVSGSTLQKRLRLELTADGDHDVEGRHGTPPVAPGSGNDCSEFGIDPAVEHCVIYPVVDGTYYYRVYRFEGTGFNITLFYEDAPATCSLGHDVTTLVSDVPRTASLNNNAATGACFFKFSGEDSSGNMAQFVLNLSNTNYDLFVRKGALPLNSTYDCRPRLGGTASETCGADLYEDDTFYAMVRRGLTAISTGTLNLRARALPTCSLGPGIHTLPVDGAVTGSLTDVPDARCYFRTQHPTSAGEVARFTLDLTAANYDLYVSDNVVPMPLAHDCRPSLSGTTQEICDRAATAQGIHYLQVRRASGGSGAADFTVRHSGVSLCSLGSATTTLTEGVSVLADVANVPGASCRFAFAPPPDAPKASVVLTSLGDGFEPNLTARAGVEPTSTQWDCRAFLNGSTQAGCEVATAGQLLHTVVSRFDSTQSGASGAFRVLAQTVTYCSLGWGDSALAEDVARSASLADQEGALCFFRFDVDPSRADVARLELAPPAGADFDLYVRKGSRPTLATFDCVSSSSGPAAEECAVDFEGATTVFAMVRRVSGQGAFTLLASQSASCSLGVGTHLLGEATDPAASLLDAAGAKCAFAWTANPALGDGARFTLHPPAGADLDLYVRKNALPTSAAFDCGPATPGDATETCDLPVTAADTLFVLVRNRQGGGAFQLQGAHFSTCGLGVGVHVLANGTAAESTLTNHAWAKCVFQFEGSRTADFVRHVLAPSAPLDANLYVRRGALPTESLYDCRSTGSGSTPESCTTLHEGTGLYYALVKRASGSGDFSAVASNVVVPTLALGVPSRGVAGGSGLQYWKVVVPAGTASLSIGLASEPTWPAQVHNLDLYVHYRTALPSLSDYDCRSATPGALETCTFSTAAKAPLAHPLGLPVELQPLPSPGAGKYFIGVHAPAGNAPYILAAAWAGQGR